MPKIQFGISSYERGRGDLPELPVINMVAEAAPTEASKVVLQSRPGLSDRGEDMGAGPVRSLFQRDGVLGGALFGVSGQEIYAGIGSLGSIDGAGPASIAGYQTFVFAAAGGGLWGWDGTTLAEIATPDSFDVTKVIIAASRAVVIREDTGKFYWSDSLETDIEALDFATAENQPDRLLDMLFIDDILMLFGAETVEFWPNTQDADLPFQPLEQRVIEKGIRATGCATNIGSTFAWVTNENQVCMADENTVLSNEGMQARIAASATCGLFTFLIEGSEYLALRLDAETQIYSRSSGVWSEFASYGQTNWMPQCFAGGVFGSALDGRTMVWGSGHEDLGEELERRFRAGFPLNSGGVRIDNAGLRTNPGSTPFLTGDHAEPAVEMRASRDAGSTWSSWRAASLGRQGEYRKKVQWRNCGMASAPGDLREFRVTAPIDWRVSDVLVNEPYGGR